LGIAGRVAHRLLRITLGRHHAWLHRVAGRVTHRLRVTLRRHHAGLHRIPLWITHRLRGHSGLLRRRGRGFWGTWGGWCIRHDVRGGALAGRTTDLGLSWGRSEKKFRLRSPRHNRRTRRPHLLLRKRARAAALHQHQGRPCLDSEPGHSDPDRGEGACPHWHADWRR